MTRTSPHTGSTSRAAVATRTSIPWVAGLLALLALLVASCHLGQETRVEKTLSFSRHFESLSGYDSLVIEVEDPEGNLLAVVFADKPTAPARLDNLEVPGWDGGPIVIFITGYMKGQAAPAYREEKRYDGKTRKTDGVIHIHPNPTLSSPVSGLTLQVGQRLPLPQVFVQPANLANPALAWSTEPSGVAAVEAGELVGLAPGAATLRVRLGGDPGRQLAFAVQVDADSRAPDRLELLQDTLRLAKDGAPRRFGIRVQPSTASAEVIWRLADSSKALLRSDGGFVGRAVGLTKVWASSRFKPGIGDSGWIAVSEPIPVAGVRFLKDSLVLYLGGAPESLAVEVLPSAANPEVLFTLSDSGKASLSGALLTAKAVGSFTVRVRSQEDTSKSHVLPVTVREAVRVEGVVAQTRTVTLYLGGPSRILAAQVLPASAPQGVRWKSLSPPNVSADPITGEIAPLLPGTAQIVATSQADSSRRDTVVVSVKADAPRLTVRADTVVSAGGTVEFRVSAAQEFGDVKVFQWDLDGDLAWDESLAGAWTGTEVELPPVSRKYDRAGTVTARFRAQDSEGNHSAVATWNLRVVGGAAVSIDSPRDNAYTNQRTIAVAWSVNGKPQDSLLTETLVVGPNVITRAARDSSGKAHSASITVHLDTTAPQKPIVSGTSPTNQKPKWTWTSGGGGGMGEFRFRLGGAAFAADAPTTRDTAHTLAADPVSGTTYTLHVQERDLAGNWSPAESLAIRYDVSSPVVAFTAPQASGTHYTSTTPVRLAGTASGPLPITKVSYRVGTGASAAATFANGAWSVAALALQEGIPAAVTVTAEDEAGNKGEAVLNLLLDATAPSPPTLSTAPAAVVAAVKGTFGWTAGSDGTTGSGLSGRYRYRLNGGAWKDTTAVLLVDLPLADGINTFDVQEQDRASLWSGSATRVVRVDTSGPVITLTGSNPRNANSTSVTLAGTVRDSSGPATMTVSGQVAGGGTVTVNGTAWTTASLTLASGPNTLVLTATDALGNDRTLSVAVNVNVPASTVVITNPADSTTVTNQSSIVVSYTIDGGAVQTKTFALATDGVHRLVVESPANPSGNVGRDTVKVTRDATAPKAPTLTRGTSPTNGLAVWTWTSGGDNAGGAGMRTPAAYRYSLNNGTSWTETSAGRHELNAADGSHTLVVQEQDKAGNWSASSAAQTIVVDKTPPTVAITYPRDNYITNLGTLGIRYRVDNGATQTVACALPTNGSRLCQASATDAAGNTATASVTVWKEANVVFFTPQGSGSGSGSSWDSAKAGIAFLANAAMNNKEAWLATGTYSAVGLSTQQSFTLLGGFDAATHPISRDDRNKTGTLIRCGSEFEVQQATSRIDGVVFDSPVRIVGGTTRLDDVRMETVDHTWGLLIQEGAVATVNNLNISGRHFPANAVMVMNNATATFNGGNIVNNTVGDGQHAMKISGGTVHLRGFFNISGNKRLSDPAHYSPPQIFLDLGELTVGTNVTLDCREEGGGGVELSTGTIDCDVP